MKATIKAHKYAFSLSEIKRVLTTQFSISDFHKPILRNYFTREWMAEYVRKQISGGQITYDGIHYNVIWYGVTPADFTHHKWFLSFRAPILGIDCLPYVLVTVKKDTSTD